MDPKVILFLFNLEMGKYDPKQMSLGKSWADLVTWQVGINVGALGM